MNSEFQTEQAAEPHRKAEYLEQAGFATAVLKRYAVLLME